MPGMQVNRYARVYTSAFYYHPELFCFVFLGLYMYLFTVRNLVFVGATPVLKSAVKVP